MKDFYKILKIEIYVIQQICFQKTLKRYVHLQLNKEERKEINRY